MRRRLCPCENMKIAYLYNMKRKYLISIGMLALLAVLFAGCKKDEIIDDGGGGTSEPETSITFTCLDDTLELSGVLVGITPNQGDRDNGIFLKSGNSDSRGRVKFENLEALTYYYSATRSTVNGAVVRKGSITMEIGDEVDRDINF